MATQETTSHAQNVAPDAGIEDRVNASEEHLHYIADWMTEHKEAMTALQHAVMELQKENAELRAELAELKRGPAD